MAKKSGNQLTDKHHTSLNDIIDEASTVVVFGKIVRDLQPTSQGHNFAQVFGYKRHSVCSKPPSPVVIALPDPDGPASDCGWDPQEFVQWTLPASFVSTQLHIFPVLLGQALASFPPAGLTNARIVSIITSSLAASGASQPAGPGSKLSDCGIFSSQQLSILTANISTLASQLGFALDNNAFANINTSSTIFNLETAIEGAKQSA